MYSRCQAILIIIYPKTGPAQTSPPVAPVKPVVDHYYGTGITDPYRYMENLKDPAVQGWIKAQNDYTSLMLGAIPGRHQLLARIQELDRSVPRVSARVLPGDVYLISKRLPAEDIEKLYSGKAEIIRTDF